MTKKQDITAILYDKRGRVLSIGQNSYVRTHPLQGYHAKKVGLPDKTFIHAEVAAIVKCKDLSKAYRIKVFRFNNKGEEMLAKPCCICASAIANTPIKVVEYTTSKHTKVPNA